jgi:hypothetical protein
MPADIRIAYICPVFLNSRYTLLPALRAPAIPRGFKDLAHDIPLYAGKTCSASPLAKQKRRVLPLGNHLLAVNEVVRTVS